MEISEVIKFTPAFAIGEMVALRSSIEGEPRDKWFICAYYVTRANTQYVITNGPEFITVFDYTIEEY